MSAYSIKDASGERGVSEHDFPLAIGGPEADIPLSGSSEPHAWMGLEDGRIFLQPTEGHTVICNGSHLHSSQWLQDGDQIDFGNEQLHFEADAKRTCFRLSPRSQKAAPILTPPSKPPREPEKTEADQNEPLKPAPFKPNPIVELKGKPSFFRPAIMVTILILLVLGGAATFLFLSKSVAVDVSPQPDSLEVKASFAPSFGSRRLMLPGSYRVLAKKEGYRALDTVIEVTGDPSQDFHLTMDKLPGFLKILGPVGAQATIDGESRGDLLDTPYELEAGDHDILIQAPRHQDFNTTVTIEGMGRDQELKTTLIPKWAPVRFTSQPSGAEIWVGSMKIGKTPTSGDIGAGNHQFQLKMKNFKTYTGQFRVVANQPLELPLATLIPADGTLEINSTPPSAMVSVNGVYKGVTPLTLTLPPSQKQAYTLHKSGFSPQKGEITLNPGAKETLNLDLPELKGKLVVNTWPAGSELLVNDKVLGKAHGAYTLPARPQKIEIRKTGFMPFSKTITPLPGMAKSLDIQLKTIAEAKKEATPDILKVGDHAMRIVKPGTFQMGASRREPGRRANETRRDIKLTRAYYLGLHEVSNAQFKKFMPEHRSGSFQEHTLETDDQPVVNITWKLAAAYCNWLSKKEGLEPFYVEKEDGFVPATPLNSGYRLPTEAEWAWAARYSGGKEKSRKYPWGSKLPAPPDSGNYADISAAGFLPGALKNYNDQKAVTAPVGNYLPNPLGIYNMGGNVAEWVHDFYTIQTAGGGKQELDPLGDPTGKYHVIRGSSWQHSTITELRLTFRDYGEKPRPDLGFRIARYVE